MFLHIHVISGSSVLSLSAKQAVFTIKHTSTQESKCPVPRFTATFELKAVNRSSQSVLPCLNRGTGLRTVMRLLAQCIELVQLQLLIMCLLIINDVLKLKRQTKSNPWSVI